MNLKERRISLLAPLICSLLGGGSLHAGGSLWSKEPFECYSVQALSSEPRLPHKMPTDGRLSTTLRIIAAQGQYEPTSFVIAPKSNVKKLELKATPLRGEKGEIPATNIDIKVVKVWYQAGTAWYSYFADPQRAELTPELLLNDEELVKVDEEKQKNYLRVGDNYRSITYPNSEATEFFNYFTEPVADSKTLKPIQLQKGKNKQIWITVKVPESATAGIYTGAIELIADGRPAGSMEVQARVLPFKLPSPKTYYNLENDYLVTLYGTGVLGLCKSLGIPDEDAENIQKAYFRNLISHGVVNILSERKTDGKDPEGSAKRLRRELELMKEAGAVMKPLLTAGWSYPQSGEDKDFEKTKARLTFMTDVLKEAVGHDDIYMTSWDEADEKRIKIMRNVTEFTNTLDMKLWVTTAKGKHFEKAGYIIDYANHGGWPDRAISSQWHSIGAKVASYASPHTGPENPDVFRRWEGMARYKANYDGSFNYIYFSGLHPTLWKSQKRNVWNDFDRGQFRQFNLVYPTVDGVVDTIAWEGFRAGIDDVRYATLLKQEAARAMKEGDANARHTAKKALMALELADAKTADLNELRQEMIESILKIQAALKK